MRHRAPAGQGAENPPHTGLYKADSAVITWWGTHTECIAALTRKRRENAITPLEHAHAHVRLHYLSEAWDEVRPTEDVRAITGRLLENHPLKAADALQLAAALEWCEGQPQGREFVSLDHTLRNAAEAEGFDVLP